MLSAYFLHLLILIGIYLILAWSLQLAVGYTGLLNLGHIAFYGIGAYVSALLVMAGLPFLVGLLAAGLIAAGFGFLLSFPVNKLKGDYLALATLGFSFVVYAVLTNWSSLTRGTLGLPGIPKPVIMGLRIADNISFFILVAVLVLICFLIIYKITSSSFGRALEATRDNELAVRSLGKNTFKLKSYSFAISAFFAGLAGSLYAHYITFIDPSSFTMLNLIPVLTIVIMGGMASLRGVVPATVILVILPELFRLIGLPSSVIGPLRQIIFSLALIIILMYRPRGFYGRVELK